MKYIQNLLELRVIDARKGQKLGIVSDLLFKEKSNQLAGIVVNNNKRNYLVPYNKLYSLGQDYVVIKNAKNLVEVDFEGFTASQELIGKKVVTNRGESLGVINDILLTESGHLEGYELSDGLVEDILKGRNILTADKQITYGQDKLIIKDPKSLMEE